ncbi:MAG TPA: hypothetical protein VGV59_17280 [Pyrinomonadaceae bacterium]|nr:hypothetical protein [Pyrinomonadaceae bacterium]
MKRQDEEGEKDGARARDDDVETAGETTAAAVTGGDEASHQAPVGADSLVRVAGDDEDDDSEDA